MHQACLRFWRSNDCSWLQHTVSCMSKQKYTNACLRRRLILAVEPKSGGVFWTKRINHVRGDKPWVAVEFIIDVQGRLLRQVSKDINYRWDDWNDCTRRSRDDEIFRAFRRKTSYEKWSSLLYRRLTRLHLVPLTKWIVAYKLISSPHRAWPVKSCASRTWVKTNMMYAWVIIIRIKQ